MPASAAVGDQAQGREALDEFGGFGGDDQVAGERNVGACAGSDSVDARDHRLGHGRKAADKRVPAFLNRGAEVDRLAGGDHSVVQILSRAKTATGAGKDDDPRISGFIERLGEFDMHLTSEAVETVGAVERDAGDVVAPIEKDGVVGHVPWLEGRRVPDQVCSGRKRSEASMRDCLVPALAISLTS